MFQLDEEYVKDLGLACTCTPEAGDLGGFFMFADSDAAAPEHECCDGVVVDDSTMVDCFWTVTMGIVRGLGKACAIHTRKPFMMAPHVVRWQRVRNLK